jgi:hypothetical protein
MRALTDEVSGVGEGSKEHQTGHLAEEVAVLQHSHQLIRTKSINELPKELHFSMHSKFMAWDRTLPMETPPRLWPISTHCVSVDSWILPITGDMSEAYAAARERQEQMILEVTALWSEDQKRTWETHQW